MLNFVSPYLALILKTVKYMLSFTSPWPHCILWVQMS